jgi:hypothetical protein
VTFRHDAGRTGLNPTETVLTPANVSSASFGLLRMLQVDGKVDAQPLYLSHLSIGGATHNVVFAATENDSAYAFDADSGAVLWHTSLLGSGETTGDGHGCDQVIPIIGVTATPVIDRSAAGGHGAIYLVAMTLDATGSYHHRLHALDVTTGAELPGSPQEITATWQPSGGTATSFLAYLYEERAALLLYNGTIYLSWTSHCDVGGYQGWIMAYSQSTLRQTAVLNVGPNGGVGGNGHGAAIWMAGNGPAVDASGNLYVLTANGLFDSAFDSSGFPTPGDYGNSFLKIATTGGGLTVSDYFALSNGVAESNADTDLGSGGELLLPDLTDSSGTVRHLVLGAGKDGNIYVVNRDSMGHFSPSANNIWQEIDNVLPGGGVYSTPAYFNGTVYYSNIDNTLKAFTVSNAKLSTTPATQTASGFTYPGTSPAVSANGTANAIVWAHENTSPAVLHAYDATNLANELYNSNQAPSGRDQFGPGNKFISPAIADGKVFIGTQSAVAVFGLLP